MAEGKRGTILITSRNKARFLASHGCDCVEDIDQHGSVGWRVRMDRTYHHALALYRALDDPARPIGLTPAPGSHSSASAQGR